MYQTLPLIGCTAKSEPVDRGLLARLCDSIRKAWTGCSVIVISEENLPQIDQVGAGYMAAQGLNPKQAFLFMAKHGIDLTDGLIWRSRRWTQYWLLPTSARDRACVITLYSCFSITPELA